MIVLNKPTCPQHYLDWFHRQQFNTFKMYRALTASRQLRVLCKYSLLYTGTLTPTLSRLLNPAEWESTSTSPQRMRVAVISKYTQATLIPLLHSPGQLDFFFFGGLKENAVNQVHSQTASLYFRPTSTRLSIVHHLITCTTIEKSNLYHTK